MGKRQHGSGGVFRRGKVYWIRFTVNGEQQRESAHTREKAVAKRLLDTRIGERAEDRLIVGAARVTFEDLVEGFLADLKANGRKTLAEAKRTVENHLAPFFHGRRAHEITTTDVNRFIAERRETLKPQQMRKPRRSKSGANESPVCEPEKLATYSAAQVNKELAALRRMFRLAIDAGRIHKAPRIKLLALRNARQGFFERHEFEAILAKLAKDSPDLQPAIHFGYLTGWRIRSEVLTLRWSNVDLDAAVPAVRLEPNTTKNGEGRTFPLTGELLALVQGQWTKHLTATPDCDHVFPGRDGGPVLRVDRSWRTACEAAGLAGKLMHDFRRTAVRNLVRSGVSERVAMAMTGHKTRSVFDRYDIVSGTDLVEAANRLDQHMRGPISTESSTIAETTADSAERTPLTH